MHVSIIVGAVNLAIKNIYGQRIFALFELEL